MEYTKTQTPSFWDALFNTDSRRLASGRFGFWLGVNLMHWILIAIGSIVVIPGIVLMAYTIYWNATYIARRASVKYNYQGVTQ